MQSQTVESECRLRLDAAGLRPMAEEPGTFGGPIVPVAYLGDDPTGWFPSVLTLRNLVGVAPLLTVASEACAPAEHIDVTFVADSLAEALAHIAEDPSVDWIVVAGEPTLAPVD